MERYQEIERTIITTYRKQIWAKFIKAITAGAFSVVLALSAAASTAVLNADAASMGDVISKAREIGMPESEIQGYISQYGGRDYTSDQYQQAVNALEGMRGKYSGGNSGIIHQMKQMQRFFPKIQQPMQQKQQIQRKLTTF